MDAAAVRGCPARSNGMGLVSIGSNASELLRAGDAPPVRHGTAGAHTF